LSATTVGSSAIVCRFSRSSWHFRFLTTDDNGGLPVRDSEQYMGEAGRRQTARRTKQEGGARTAPGAPTRSHAPLSERTACERS